VKQGDADYTPQHLPRGKFLVDCTGFEVKGTEMVEHSMVEDVRVIFDQYSTVELLTRLQDARCSTSVIEACNSTVHRLLGMKRSYRPSAFAGQLASGIYRFDQGRARAFQAPLSQLGVEGRPNAPGARTAARIEAEDNKRKADFDVRHRNLQKEKGRKGWQRLGGMDHMSEGKTMAAGISYLLNALQKKLQRQKNRKRSKES
jgi:hypothetical protein